MFIRLNLISPVMKIIPVCFPELPFHFQRIGPGVIVCIRISTQIIDNRLVGNQLSQRFRRILKPCQDICNCLLIRNGDPLKAQLVQ